MQASPAESSSGKLNVPPIVRIVLSEMAKMRSTGIMDERTFESNLQRLRREELQPRGLGVAIQELSDGRTRFVIGTKNCSEVYEWIEYVPGIASAC